MQYYTYYISGRASKTLIQLKYHILHMDMVDSLNTNTYRKFTMISIIKGHKWLSVEFHAMYFIFFNIKF